MLDRGRIVERGTHDELIALDGRYIEFLTGASVADDVYAPAGGEEPAALS